jgi:hypothetical protein
VGDCYYGEGNDGRFLREKGEGRREKGEGRKGRYNKLTGLSCEEAKRGRVVRCLASTM